MLKRVKREAEFDIGEVHKILKDFAGLPHSSIVSTIKNKHGAIVTIIITEIEYPDEPKEGK